MHPGWVIAALLIGVALFGFLRARSVVSETWGIRSERSLVGLVAVVAAVVFLLLVARSWLGVVVGAAVLGIALYASWRLRRA